jgi:methionine sulfoxide reductase heme-binding subunit
MRSSLPARHLVVGLCSLAVGAIFWFGRLNWDPEMRLWRAVGDASLVLLIVALVAGPLARLWSGARPLLGWRREAGIWFGVLAAVHSALVWHGWARWDVPRLLGYEFIPQLGRVARIEPGFGLANLMGLVALALALVLTATSSDWAVRQLGAAAWKWLQYGAYTVFYLVALHTAYFLFMHYTLSFHRPVPPDANWFQLPFLALAAVVPLSQLAAFARTVARRSTGGGATGATPGCAAGGAVRPQAPAAGGRRRGNPGPVESQPVRRHQGVHEDTRPLPGI